MNDRAKPNPRLRQALIVAVCVLAVLLFLYLLLRDRPGSANDYLDDSAPYTFDSSANRTFRTVDSRLAVVSSSGLQLLDDSGKTVLHEIFTLAQPGISVGGERVCAYDIGGTTLCVADFKGNKTDITPSGEIISADLSESGYLAVCTEAAGYKGAVTVYDASGKAVYVWYSGTGYLVRAAVSPDGKYLAALCLQDTGSAVHTFTLTSADERGSTVCADELFADLFWRGGRICCVSQSRLAFFDDSAKLADEYSFGDLYLYDYAAEGDGFVTLALSRYRSGSAAQLVTVNSGGNVLGECTPTGSVTSLSVNGKQVLVQYSDRLTLYNQQLDVVKLHREMNNLMVIYGLSDMVYRGITLVKYYAPNGSELSEILHSCFCSSYAKADVEVQQELGIGRTSFYKLKKQALEYMGFYFYEIVMPQAKNKRFKPSLGMEEE